MLVLPSRSFPVDSSASPCRQSAAQLCADQCGDRHTVKVTSELGRTVNDDVLLSIPQHPPARHRAAYITCRQRPCGDGVRVCASGKITMAIGPIAQPLDDRADPDISHDPDTSHRTESIAHLVIELSLSGSQISECRFDATASHSQTSNTSVQPVHPLRLTLEGRCRVRLARPMACGVARNTSATEHVASHCYWYYDCDAVPASPHPHEVQLELPM